VPTGIARLLELARALALDPRLLLLDEPSSGLSGRETEVFGDLLRDLAAEGRAVLIVEHDMDLIMRVCNRIHVLNFGEVIASGPPDAIRADERVQRAYLGQPA
jgi:branched-chain amino acid transport system ATP-binding protein